MVSIIIAEDEEILRLSLRKKLNKFWPEAQIVAECCSGEEALAALEQLQPDIAFLDVQMGALSGIDVACCNLSPCELVFVTAYDQYAIKAFETGAIDYLLKPYSDARLQQCIARLQQRLSARQPAAVAIPGDNASTQLPYLDKLTLQLGNKIWLQQSKDILYFHANGRYVEVKTTEREFVVRTPLKELERLLDPAQFWRIHRSTIINITWLDFINTADSDQMLAWMKGCATPLNVSRSAQHLFKPTEWSQ
ncbi:LytR/AlgR family response regulator transcription factor [Alishewanella longhuensis]